MNYLFGAKNKELLKKILKDTDPHFAKWAINAMTTWRNVNAPKNLIKIHGNKDLLIPVKRDSHTFVVKNGHHFMIVDRADEINQIINNEIPKYL